MDMRKVFPDIGNIPSHLLAKVEMSRLKGELCSVCASINETFSKVCRLLEQIEMEAISSLEPIYKKFLKGGGMGGTDELRKLSDSMEQSRHEWSGKLDILEVLRKDAILKCSAKLSNVRPRIRLSNLTEGAILKEKQKCNRNSPRRPISERNSISIKSDHEQLDPFPLNGNDRSSSPILQSRIKTEIGVGENIPDPCYDDQDVNFDSDVGSPPSPNNWGGSTDAVKSESKITSHSRDKSRKRHAQRRTHSGVNINENVEMVKGNKFQCRLCTKKFCDRKNTIRHIKMVHLKEKHFQCSHCSKAFSLRHVLDIHMLGHTGVKPYKCHLCPKDFFQKGHLQRHLLVHSGTRAHKCGTCGKAFLLKYELTNHIRNAH